MNEKIKQLLAQAHLEVENIKDTNKIAEKFAELIVKECLKEINDMIVDESEQLYPNNKQTTEYVNERLMDAHDNIVDLFEIRFNANYKRMICPRCKIEKVLGVAIDPERDEYAIYIAPLPPITQDRLKLVDVYKCPKCGHSEKVEK